MLRVLHLAAEPSDEQSRGLSELLASAAAPAAAVERQTIGRGGTYRSVVDATLRLRRELRQFDVLHVWDATGRLVAGWLRAPRVVASFSALPRGASLKTPTGIHWVCSTPYQLSVVRQRFGGRHRCTLVEPGAPRSEQPARDRHALRARLGLDAEDRVLLAPGESTREAGHDDAVWVTSMLHIIDARYKLLIAGAGPYAEAARSRAAALNRPDLLRIAADHGVDGSITEVADAVLFTPSGRSAVLPVAECMAAGLPVVSTDHPTLRGFFIEGRGALLADWKTPPSVARRVLELFERPGLLQSTAAQAREAAATRFAMSECIKQYLAVYRELVERRNETPAFA